MPYPYVFSTTLAQPATPAADLDVLWQSSPDAAALDRLQARRARVLQAGTGALAGLAPRQVALQDLVELLEQAEPDGTDGPDPAAQALARYQRHLDLSAARPYGRIGLQLFDTLAWIEVELADPAAWAAQRPLLQQDLAALLDALARADGLQATPMPGSLAAGASAQAQAGALLDAQAAPVAWRARGTRAMARQAGLSRPAVALVGLLAAALTCWLLLDAYRVGTLARMTDAGHPLPFITDRMEEQRAGWGLFPVFVLHGHVQTDAAQPVVREAALRVPRIVALRTGNGARYTVLPTRDPAQPYVLRNVHDDTGSVLALGRHGLHWSALLAVLPLPLWYAGMARPWRAAARVDAGQGLYARHRLVRAWGSLLLWGAAMAAIAFASRKFG
ncbi:hypothetical protein [Pseudorhodoferax sp.]|uniref:hypothetical protein n=1 Tax=Pseudorhodoferax sp. TaxID=1993553 RepID=UPI002DD625F5|nr:hypothetical protein [Pseudorhodoferax sp.]